MTPCHRPFCDWLSLSGDVHPGYEWPVIQDGATWKIDAEGNLLTETPHRAPVMASHETSIRIRCDGRHLELDGNIGRLGRPDNVTGYSTLECFQRALCLLDRLGIASSLGQSYTRHELESGKVSRLGWRFRRVDLTRNFDLVNQSALDAFIRQSAQVSLEGRKRLPVFENGSVVWGKHSTYWGAKLYDKRREINDHSGQYPVYAPLHLARLEAVIRRGILVRLGWDNPDMWRDPSQQVSWWEETFARVLKGEVAMEDRETMSLRVRGAIAAWERGENLRLSMSKRSFYRLKSEVKASCGIDLDIPRLAANVIQFPVKTQTIVIRPVDLRPVANLPAIDEFPGLTFKKIA